MTQRVDYQQQAPELFNKLSAFNMEARRGSVEESVCSLVEIRASQIN